MPTSLALLHGSMRYAAEGCKSFLTATEKRPQVITTAVDGNRPLVHGRLAGAARLGVSLRTFDELLATKQIKSLRVGRRRMVSEESLVEFIKRQERASR